MSHTLHGTGGGKRLKRHHSLYQADVPNNKDVVWILHDDILQAVNSASYVPMEWCVWAGRVADDKDSCIGLKTTSTNKKQQWNVGGIDGFQWDIDTYGVDRHLLIVLCDIHGVEVEWTTVLHVKAGEILYRTAMDDFVPSLDALLHKKNTTDTSTDETKRSASEDDDDNNNIPKLPTRPGLITSLTILYSKTDPYRNKRNRSFTAGEFRLKMDSITTY